MKITVVGHWGGFPKVGEATSCYLIEHDGFKLLVDCGSGALSQLQHYCSLDELDAVIISHYHHDHIADIGSLQYSRQVAQALKTTNKPIHLYGHLYDQQQFAKLAKPPYTLSFLYDEKHEASIGPFRISFLKTNHSIPCFAMRIEVVGKTVVYSADSSYKQEFHQFAHLADLFFCETSFYAHQDGKPYGHMNSLEAASIAQAASVKKLVLTHLPHFGDPKQLVTEAKSIFTGEIHLASKGLTIEI